MIINTCTRYVMNVHVCVVKVKNSIIKKKEKKLKSRGFLRSTSTLVNVCSVTGCIELSRFNITFRSQKQNS